MNKSEKKHIQYPFPPNDTYPLHNITPGKKRGYPSKMIKPTGISDIGQQAFKKVKNKPTWHGGNSINLMRITFQQSDYITVIFDYKLPGLKTSIENTPWISYNEIISRFLFKDDPYLINAFNDNFGLNHKIDQTGLHRFQASSNRIEISQAHAKIITRNKSLPIANLASIMMDDEPHIAIQVKYNKVIFEKLRLCTPLEYHKIRRTFTFSANNEAFSEVLKALKGLCDIRVSNAIEINDAGILLLVYEHSYPEDQYRSCPVEYIENMLAANLSLQTIKTYHHFFLRFINNGTFKNWGDISGANETVINQYHEKMAQTGVGFSSLNQSINAIKYYYNHILGVDIDHIKLRRPKGELKLPKVLAQGEISSIVQHTNNLKHKCILALLYGSGIRIGELINLKVIDFCPDENKLWIRGGKGKKDGAPS